VYRLELRPSAVKDLDRLRGETWERVKGALLALGANPQPPGCVKLVGDAAWRIREGDWRVIYDIDDAAQVVTILRVKHRKDAYRES
jgi:mRNA interferase RelE/StbE